MMWKSNPLMFFCLISSHARSLFLVSIAFAGSTGLTDGGGQSKAKSFTHGCGLFVVAANTTSSLQQITELVPMRPHRTSWLTFISFDFSLSSAHLHILSKEKENSYNYHVCIISRKLPDCRWALNLIIKVFKKVKFYQQTCLSCKHQEFHRSLSMDRLLWFLINNFIVAFFQTFICHLPSRARTFEITQIKIKTLKPKIFLMFYVLSILISYNFKK